jgi:hypothetical protein
MTAQEISNQLDQIAARDDFASASWELAEKWKALGVGVEAVDPILQFMENHPAIDYGTPGALVHFTERFYQKGYDEKLIESVRRKPTVHTAWMLNRLINGTKDDAAKKQLVEIMSQAKSSLQADPATVQEIEHYLEFQGE